VRLQVLNEVEGGGLNMREAAEMMTLSLRQVRRLRRAYHYEGAQGLAHRNRGDDRTMRLRMRWRNEWWR